MSLRFTLVAANNMKKNNSKRFYPTIRYEPEADILSWELSSDKIADASEAGNLIVHFNAKRQPVYVEMLNARSFIQGTMPIVRESKKYQVVRLQNS